MQGTTNQIYLILLCTPTFNIGFCYPCEHKRPRLYIKYKRSSAKWTWRHSGNLQTSFPCGRWSDWCVRDGRKKHKKRTEKHWNIGKFCVRCNALKHTGY